MLRTPPSGRDRQEKQTKPHIPLHKDPLVSANVARGFVCACCCLHILHITIKWADWRQLQTGLRGRFVPLTSPVIHVNSTEYPVQDPGGIVSLFGIWGMTWAVRDTLCCHSMLFVWGL